MRKCIIRTLAFVMTISTSLCGCDEKANSGYIDLTTLSSVIVYSQVNSMMTEPDDYIGKTVKAKGEYSAEFYEETDKYYHYVVIADATSCCQQGIEFIWSGEHTYPGDYPEPGNEIEIAGVFKEYTELDVKYYYLQIEQINIV